MSVPSDVGATPISPAFQTSAFPEPNFEREPRFEHAPGADDARTFREINARRAQLENPEMLRRLRGL